MALAFKVIDSPQNEIIGSLVPLYEGLLIGRTRGNWIIEDNRVSSTHAEIQSNNQGHLLLVDKGSRNGIKVQGRNISKILLFPGLILQIGDTLIEVMQVEERSVSADKKQNLSKQLLEDSLQTLKNFNIEGSEALYKKPQFFTKSVHLEVIQGLQLNQQWFLDFGPFKFGAGCIGGLLVGKNMPEEVFEIFLGTKGPMIKPLSQEKILKLNSIDLESESLLENKDVLTITLPNENITRIRFAL